MIQLWWAQKYGLENSLGRLIFHFGPNSSNLLQMKAPCSPLICKWLFQRVSPSRLSIWLNYYSIMQINKKILASLTICKWASRRVFRKRYHRNLYLPGCYGYGYGLSIEIFFFFLNLNKLDRISTFKLQSLLYDDAFLFFSFLNGYDDDSYH